MTDDVATIEHLQVRRSTFGIDDLSLGLARGRVVGLVGPNGAGKTTVIRSLLGLMVPDAGKVELFGLPAGSPAALARTGIVLDQPTAAPEWRVGSLGRRFALFYPRWDERRFVALLDRLAVPRGQRVDQLSRGQGVKLAMALALAASPELLILDEPSSGLDPASRRNIGDVIREFMRDPNHAVLFSTHITTDLDRLADEVVVLVAGRIAYRGSLSDAREHFAVVRGSGPGPHAPVIGLERSGGRWWALIRRADSTAAFGAGAVIEAASIDDIVIHLAAEQREVAE